ncbi:hypothetical protein EJ02DRAFT_251804 [Clathrospora elynae]|uniref:Uncharacterized protein n=1 Tax=Clathrospora elynae TaxID=706981 RepID=A0A6A5SGC3_9PLEO|nr:hypothetical protein EJ02DRAFT_251804 [Clathrospora elynae]
MKKKTEKKNRGLRSLSRLPAFEKPGISRKPGTLYDISLPTYPGSPSLNCRAEAFSLLPSTAAQACELVVILDCEGGTLDSGAWIIERGEPLRLGAEVIPANS